MRSEIIDGVHRRDTMKAIVQDTYGSPDVLQLREIDKPVVGDGDVLVRVHAAGVDQGVWHLMAGLPYLVRVAGVGLRAPRNPIRGVDVGGRVEAVGENVIQFQAGDEVFGTCRGSFAEYACGRSCSHGLCVRSWSPGSRRSRRKIWRRCTSFLKPAR
jgi:D-arabinose 1-dehydrogenase-like Zn-dependent alcohol dehydrogenase